MSRRSSSIRVVRQAAAAPESPSARAAARLAQGDETPVASPVHRLQAELAVRTVAGAEIALKPYPGWFRVGFPVVTSAAMWAAIIWVVLRVV